MAVYAIGDIQGCFDELQMLLNNISFNSDKDKLWLCGDLINRGPKSLQTLEFIHSIRDNVVTVLGNHDLHLLATYYQYKKPGRKDTLDDILQSPGSAVLLDWLRRQPLLHHDPDLDISLVHAGIHPLWSLEQARALAAEVESVLSGKEHKQFFKHMYGDKPHYWSETLSSWSRLRFITNILTRVRYFAPDNKACLNAKGAPGSQQKGQIPWFDIPDRATTSDRIIFGHWSTLCLVEREYYNVYPMDTGCLWGGRLTAMRIDEAPFTTSYLDCSQQQQPDGL